MTSRMDDERTTMTTTTARPRDASAFDLHAAEALARAALPVFGFSPEARLEFVKHRENHTYRVTDGDQVAALRVHRSGYRDDTEITSELRWIALLSERGVPVPQVRPTRSGDPFAVVRRDGHERRVSVQAWLDAEPAGDVGEWFASGRQPGPELFAAIGELAARLHAAAEQIGTPAWLERAPWDCDGLAGEAPRWGVAEDLPTLTEQDRRLFARARARAREQIAAIPQDARHYGVIHADLTPENVLRGRDGRHVAIDFDDFGEGYYLFDLATTLWWATRLEHIAQLWAAMLDGYRSVRPLTAADLAGLDAMVIARCSSYLGWAAARAGDEAAAWIVADVAPWARVLCAAYLDGSPLPWHPSSNHSRKDHDD